MWLLDRCRHEVEDDPGRVAFIRWYLFKTRWLTICLHKFLKSDCWPPHNHDYDSISLILRGRYFEDMFKHGRGFKTYHRRRWQLWFRHAEDFHRIALPDKQQVWTLFFQFNYRGADFRVGYAISTHGFMPLGLYDAIRGRKPDKLEFRGWFLPTVVRTQRGAALVDPSVAPGS